MSAMLATRFCCLMIAAGIRLIGGDPQLKLVEGLYNTSDYAHANAPVILTKPSQLTAAADTAIVLNCSVHQQGDHVVVWRRGRRVVTAAGVMVSRNDRFSLLPDNALSVDKVQPEDAGLYSCSVDTEPLLEISHQLIVMYGPLVWTIPASGTLMVLSGETVHMSCRTKGYPQPTISWRRQNGRITPAAQSRDAESVNLTLTHASRHHSGVYKCVASVGAASAGVPSTGGVQLSASATVLLHVQYPPEVSAVHPIVYSADGREVDLVCRALADPTPQVSWSRVGAVIGWSRHAITDQLQESGSAGGRYTLHIHPVQGDDFGTYRCTATNDLGSANATLVLSGSPESVRVLSGPVADKDSIYMLKWQAKCYTPLLEYMLSYRAVNDSAAVTDWKEMLVPSVGGDVINGIIYRQEVMLTGLSPSTRYEVYVRARNQYGWSEKSAVHRFATMAFEAALESRPVDNHTTIGAARDARCSLATLLFLTALALLPVI